MCPSWICQLQYFNGIFLMVYFAAFSVPIFCSFFSSHFCLVKVVRFGVMDERHRWEYHVGLHICLDGGKKKQVWPCKEDNEQRRLWKEGMRGQAEEELHQHLSSRTMRSSQLGSDISFLPATMWIHNLHSAAGLSFVRHESTGTATSVK